MAHLVEAVAVVQVEEDKIKNNNVMSDLQLFLLVISIPLILNIIGLICVVIFHNKAWQTLKGFWEKFAFVVYMLVLGVFYWVKVLIDYIRCIIVEKRNRK